MVLNMRTKDEISPTLRHLVDRFDEDNRRPLDTYTCAQESAEQDDSTCNNDIDIDGDASHNDGTWDYDHDEQTSMVEEEHNYENTSFPSYHEVYITCSHTSLFNCIYLFHWSLSNF